MLNGRTLEFTVQPMENGGMVALVEDITERKIAEAKINHLARFDPLTGLPNRNVLRERMERALGEWRPDNMCAIHFVDLDQFKQVNDTLGHTRGDMLLQAVAERLRVAMRDADVICRFGGDEFVILQAPLASLDQGEALAASILEALAGTYDLDGHKVAVTASIGIAVANHRIDPDQFLRNADLALYRAKVRRARHMALVRGEDGSHRPGAQKSGIRFAQGAGERGVRTLLSAAVQSEDQADRGLRGAAAMAAPRARHGFPGGIHPGRRRNGTDRRDRQSGALQGLPGMPAMAGRNRCRGQSVVDPVRPFQRTGAGP